MKTMKTFFAAVLLLVGVGAASAQATYTAGDGTQYEFKKHFFVNVEGGAQYTLGEAQFSDLISPNVQIGLGYQFSPVLAVRLQGNGWQSKGGWPGGLPDAPKAYTYKYKYVAPGLDVMINLSNLIAGYNPLRTVSLTAFLGGGANIGFSNDEVNTFASSLRTKTGYLLEYLWDGTKVRPYGRGGLELGFRLSDAVNLLIEGNANILSDKYNSKKAGNADWYFNALAGLRINLGKTYTKLVPPAPVPEPQPVVEVVQPEPAPATAAVEVVKEEVVEPIRRDIFFLINKTDIRAGAEAQKVKDIADYMKKYPNSKVTITGYADAGTGNDKINDRLAAQRADAVVKALRDQYGISASRISYDSKGARVQPFAENDMNRVSVCIAE